MPFTGNCHCGGISDTIEEAPAAAMAGISPHCADRFDLDAPAMPYPGGAGR